MFYLYVFNKFATLDYITLFDKVMKNAKIHSALFIICFIIYNDCLIYCMLADMNVKLSVSSKEEIQDNEAIVSDGKSLVCCVHL